LGVESYEYSFFVVEQEDTKRAKRIAQTILGIVIFIMKIFIGMAQKIVFYP